MALDKIKSDAPEVSGDVPAVFVVNCQLPEGEPAMFNSPDDGPGRRQQYHVLLHGHSGLKDV